MAKPEHRPTANQSAPAKDSQERLMATAPARRATDGQRLARGIVHPRAYKQALTIDREIFSRSGPLQ